MIYTVTFNPSLDYIVTVDNFRIGTTNRTSFEYITVGGKGINVSIVLNNLDISSCILGFTAGFVGLEIQKRIKELGIRSDFINIENENSRINVKLKSDSETEINAKGPNITKDNVDTLLQKIDNVLKDGDILVLSGSVPNGISKTIYREIMQMLCNRNVKTVVDAEGELLLNTLSCKPFLIKPNLRELSDVFGAEIKDHGEVVEYAKKLQNKGARNVLVSLAGDGAVLVAENGEDYMVDAPKGELINSVGAGDSMVAGFISGFMEKEDYLYALYKGVSSGSASAFSKKFATKEEVEKVYNSICS